MAEKFQFSIPDPLEDRLDQAAEELGLSKAEITRAGLNRELRDLGVA